MYRGPFPTVESRRPVRMMPQQIFGARPYLQQLEGGSDVVGQLPVLLLWADHA